ncbi:hypothetical protein [Flavobacterium sp.]
MNKVTINPSIAAIVNIDPIGQKEIVPIYFTADSNWIGTYQFTVFNSDKKNTKLHEDNLPTVNELMTLTVNAQTMNLPIRVNYYEITKVEDNRIVFKGTLNIIE